MKLGELGIALLLLVLALSISDMHVVACASMRKLANEASVWAMGLGQKIRPPREERPEI